ncbi:PAS domain-containing protein [Haloferax namakaokahaiae]|uniref:PAS domain-containing protein n=1 Tax=Haloferax namakaokahaiae TaxID=1748331 RepID=A0ABD5ZBL9_9EURY
MSRASETAVTHLFSQRLRDDPIEVLHVEDDRRFAELSVAFLERDSTDSPPLEVRTETDPTAVTDQLDEVDCVVSDYDMPERDGLELLEKVREFDAELPFILFTGRGSEEIASKAISAGVTDYLRKGGGAENFDVLANRIRNAVATRRAEQAADQSHRLLRDVIDQLPQCIFVKDVEGQYLLINEAGAASYGETPAEIEGKTESEVNDPELAARFHEEDQTVIEDGETARIRDQYRIDDEGDEYVEEVTKTPFGVETASPTAILGIADEVTEERRKAAQLDSARELAAQLRTRFDAGDDSPTRDELVAALDDLETTLSDPDEIDLKDVLQDDEDES